MPVIPTLIPISKVVRKPGLVVRKIEKVGRKSSNCRRFFRGTFHAGGHFPGRSCLFPGDLPCWRPFSRKVLPFSGGPSTLEAIFPEGPAFFRGTFHAGGHFPGRSCLFPGDLPCWRPFSRKVLPFSGGPSVRSGLNRSGFVFLGAEMTGFLYIFIVDRLIDQDEDEQKDYPDRDPVAFRGSLPPGPAGSRVLVSR